MQKGTRLHHEPNPFTPNCIMNHLMHEERLFKLQKDVPNFRLNNLNGDDQEYGDKRQIHTLLDPTYDIQTFFFSCLDANRNHRYHIIFGIN